MNLEDALPTFIDESRELLEQMESALLQLGEQADPTESVHAIFRAAHTIKGSAGLFGLDGLVAFTHVAESVLDRVRDGEVALGPELVQLLLACCDHLGLLVDAAAEHRDPGDAAQAAGQALSAQLGQYLQAPAAAAAAASAPAAAGQAARWQIEVHFGPDVLRNGMDPLSIVRYLGTLGTLERVLTLDEALPPLADMDAEACALGLAITLASSAGRAALEDAFAFVIDDCRLRIDPVEPAAPVAALPVAEAEPAPEAPADTAKGRPAREGASVRVDADKLDRLINLVGELITASSAANMVARRAFNVELQEATSTLGELVQEVRDSALQLRMVKIGATFGRFKRVVHEVARDLGKDIVLRVSGEDTELDKTVVEKIGDPLTHLVRNAIDHGIDGPEQRAARGKPAQGTVSLNAFHDSGSIVIEVSDDGGGLDRERILAKGIERGLVEPGKTLSDDEVYALIFEPGFSTAAQVTNLSGRGVGMDVVKRNIAALRGSVSIRSEAGRGTTVSVRLPLTLAIINGFQVAVGDSVFVVPLDMVDECVQYTSDEEQDYTDLRGQVLPFVRLRRFFGLPGSAAGRQNIVVVKYGAQRIGLVVDTLLGEAQTVIKPLSKVFAQVRGVAGSSILGSGDVALILDVPSLVQRASSASRAETALG